MRGSLHTARNHNCYYNPNSLTCQLMISKVESVIKDLNLYDILEPCHHSPTSKEDENANTSLPLSFKQLGVTERPLVVRKRIFGRAWPLRALVRDGIVPMWPQLMENSVVPCIVLFSNKVIATGHAGVMLDSGYVSGYKNRFQNFIRYLREMGDEVNSRGSDSVKVNDCSRGDYPPLVVDLSDNSASDCAAVEEIRVPTRRW